MSRKRKPTRKPARKPSRSAPRKPVDAQTRPALPWPSRIALTAAMRPAIASWGHAAFWRELTAYLYPEPDVALVTHEAYLNAVADACLTWAHKARRITCEERAHLALTRFGYAVSMTRGVLGSALAKGWHAAGADEASTFVSVYAHPQADAPLLAYTVVHELSHGLTYHRGNGAGHDPGWANNARALGMEHPSAQVGSVGWLEFHPGLALALMSLPTPNDGNVRPEVNPDTGAPLPPPKIKRCQHGTGSKGGTSRGQGAGSRYRLYVCDCGTKVRHAGDDLDATHGLCGSRFVLREASIPHSAGNTHRVHPDKRRHKSGTAHHVNEPMPEVDQKWTPRADADMPF